MIVLAGAPAWLAGIAEDASRPWLSWDARGVGGSYRLDGLWAAQDATFLIEVKYREQGQAGGLLQVLGEAELLRSYTSEVRLKPAPQNLSAPITPVLITAYSDWYRNAGGVLKTLRASGVGLRYLEACLLETKDSIEGLPREVLLLDEPFEEWDQAPSSRLRLPVELPAALLEELPQGLLDEIPEPCWRRVATTGAWIGSDLDSGAPRPTVWRRPYASVTPVNDREDAWVIWAGRPGDPRRSGTFYLWSTPPSLNSTLAALEDQPTRQRPTE
jgi:hypothetical protein